MIIRYNYHHTVGKNIHKIELYDFYSDEDGLQNLRSSFESSKMTEVRRYFLKNCSVSSPDQAHTFHTQLKNKEDCIIFENGDAMDCEK